MLLKIDNLKRQLPLTINDKGKTITEQNIIKRETSVLFRVPSLLTQSKLSMFIQRVSEFFYTKRPYICDFNMERGWRRLEKFVTCLWILLFSKNRPIVHFC